ncbi:cation channel sperm-associated auxiliary subunit delta isoform X2 [Arvicanthis niloticus]|uniref:cation channel sperm-associated auxiliary subunit delta isoform X2 n=2 Tax=Arvicanthis niloticus TaxID=61156 RepID=UPI00148654BF|nr:cation channel sperm-associated protein subunit delta isoform X2 [Arvicanthis niloticus]
MLMLMVVAAVATMVRAELCRMRTVRTGKVFTTDIKLEGDLLFYAFPNTLVLQNLCKTDITLYLGKKVFLTTNSFESSTLPLTVPESMAVGVPSVTSAHFLPGSVILFVISGKVYSYNFDEHSWRNVEGVTEPVSHISGDTCCFEGSFCLELSNYLFAYLRGGQIPGTNIYFSDNGGFSFQFLHSNQLSHLNGTLGGIFHFHSMSQVGILMVKNDSGTFHYTEHPLNHSMGISFSYKNPLEVIMKPHQRGFLVLWSKTSILVSSNSGQIVEPVQLVKENTFTNLDVESANINIHSIAWNTHELAFFAAEDHLYYGSQSYTGTYIIKLIDDTLWSEDMSIYFENTGMLVVLTPVADPHFVAFDFHKCVVNMQNALMNEDLHLEPCNVELLESAMVNTMFTIDMNSKLKLSALVIPRMNENPIPLVMVSNPHALGFKANFSEFGNTFDGNSKYKLDIELKQQYHWDNSEVNFTSSIKLPAISSITVDIADKTLSCVDLKPLSTLISVGCDMTKKIVVQNKISACTMGILNPVQLQKNYTYSVEWEAYNPVSYDGEAKDDLIVFYQYKDLGCPRLVYYDKPWIPVVELWKNGILEEIMKAEYVISEVNGLITYSYSLTAATANCRSQPQNWSTFESDIEIEQPILWNRENYVSCHEDNQDNPLLWPNVEYQVLGGQTDNRVIFGQRNGIYTFHLSVVDPYYSYCNLHTIFSVYVYGALPVAKFQPLACILLIVGTTLLTVWLAYAIPKQLRTKRGQQLSGFCSLVFQNCLGICTCAWLRGKLRRWLRSRRVKNQPDKVWNTGRKPDFHE